MFAVAIPTYNEVDNIKQLVRKIDECSKSIGLPLIIINADNSSPDGTAKIFKETKTIARKISIKT